MTRTTMRSHGATLLREPSVVQLRPRFEGSNICTWIGFKHVNYLVEEAVLEHFLRRGMGAGAMYEDYGLCFDVVSVDTRILTALHIDDVATLEVVPTTAPHSDELAFAVTIHVHRDGDSEKAATSKVAVVLRADDQGTVEPPPPWIHRFVVPRIDRAGDAPPHEKSASANREIVGRSGRSSGGSGRDPVLDELTGGNAFGWKWRVPYFYCHFTERVQMSGYLRLMEEVVDLFLEDRGISIRDLLTERSWIPVVPRSSISMLGEALMEEEVYTVFTVEEVFKRLTYTARMDCYVRCRDALVRTATGRITHGYAVIDNRRDWSLASFDDRVLAALRGGADSRGEAAWNGS